MYESTDLYKLTDKQVEGIQFLIKNPNSILGDKPGMGKTLQALSLANYLMEHFDNKYKETKDNKVPIVLTCIICPKSATTAFKKELDTRVRLPYIINTTELSITTSKNARIFIFNYSNTQPLENLLFNIEKLNKKRDRKIKVIGILDEIHKLSNVQSQVTRKFYALRKHFAIVYGLTATPLLNNLLSLYSIVTFLRPNYLGHINRFKSNFIIYNTKILKGRKINEVVGYKNLDILKERMKGIYISRGKDYEIAFENRQIDLNDYEKEQYDIASRGLLSLSDYGKQRYALGNEQAFAARLHSLQMVVDGSRRSEFKNGNYLLTDFSKTEECTKVKELLKLVQEIMDREESCIIYTDYDETFKLIEYHIKKNKNRLQYSNLFFISGSTSDNERRKPENRIIPRSIVLITKAGSESINLQRANNIIFYSIPFSLYTVIQAIGRICRVDTKFNTQHIYTIEAKGTIDSYKALLIEEHKNIISEIFSSKSLQNLPKFTNSLTPGDITKYKKFLRKKLLWNR